MSAAVTGTGRPQISVVVPTYRRPALLDTCLRSLASSTVPPDAFEVVVVDDGSGDRTPQVLAAHTGRLPLTSLAQPVNAGPAAARNRGIAAARAELILFLDDDVAVSPGLLATHLALHGAAGDRKLGVLGRVDWHPDLAVTAFMRWLDTSGLQFGYDTWLTEGPVEPPYAAFYTANLSIHRSLLEEVGGFDQRFPFPAYEDMELAYRLSQKGFRLDYRPAAQAWHARAIDLRTFRRRMANVARSAELLRAAAPQFPLDDADLLAQQRSRPRRWAIAAAAALHPDERRRAAHYWSQVAAAYAGGRRRARRTGRG